jgi:HSP20 family molecular chaperone IbpA
MANEKTHEVQRMQEGAAGTAVEQTRPRPVVVPAVDIFEEGDRLTLLADMPGVEPSDLKIDLHENVLSMTGDVRDPEGEGESDVFREYRSGTFHRQFTLSNRIDQSKIEASLTDGVLRLVLPKAEATKPRAIEIKTG